MRDLSLVSLLLLAFGLQARGAPARVPLQTSSGDVVGSAVASAWVDANYTPTSPEDARGEVRVQLWLDLDALGLDGAPEEVVCHVLTVEHPGKGYSMVVPMKETGPGTAIGQGALPLYTRGATVLVLVVVYPNVLQPFEVPVHGVH